MAGELWVLLGAVFVGVGVGEAAGAIGGGGGGNVLPERDFTNAMSALSIKPSRLMSSRKFEIPTAFPDCDFV